MYILFNNIILTDRDDGIVLNLDNLIKEHIPLESEICNNATGCRISL